jgi:hypothetical protein
MEKVKVKLTVARTDAASGSEIEVSAAEAGRMLRKGQIVTPGAEVLEAIKRAAEAEGVETAAADKPAAKEPAADKPAATEPAAGKAGA